MHICVIDTEVVSKTSLDSYDLCGQLRLHARMMGFVFPNLQIIHDISQQNTMIKNTFQCS